jgi:hypothetical protein
MSYRIQALELASSALEALCVEVSSGAQPPSVPESLRGLVRDYANGDAKQKFSSGKLSADVLYQVNTVWNGLKQGHESSNNDAIRAGYFWMGASLIFCGKYDVYLISMTPWPLFPFTSQRDRSFRFALFPR